MHWSFKEDRQGASLAVLTLALLGALVFAAPAQGVETFPLEIEYPGFGSGEIQCKVGTGKPGACKSEYAGGTKLTLVPVPGKGSEFVGFENGFGSAEGCVGQLPCEFKIEEESYVEALFEPTQDNTVTVNISGEGEVSCESELGSECGPGVEYEYGTEITLVAEEAPGWEFLGFKNGKGSTELELCVGPGSCSFFIEGDSTIDAVFVPKMHALTITKAGTGQGTVTCNGATCAPSYAEGTEVTLKATPASGSTFAGWSGEECSGTGTCVVRIETAPASVTATFQANSKPPPPTPEPEGTAKVGAIAKVKADKAQVKLSCTGGSCTGILKLTAKVRNGTKRRSVTIGKVPFSLADGASRTLKVKLSAGAMSELKKARSLRARASGTAVIAGAVKLKLA